MSIDNRDQRDPEKLGLAILATKQRLKCGILDAADAVTGQFSERSPTPRVVSPAPMSPEENGAQRADPGGSSE